MPKFSLQPGRSRKGRPSDTVTVIEHGHPVFRYTINIPTLTCACQGGKESRLFCEHLTFYLQSVGVRSQVVAYLRVPYVRNLIRDKGITTGSDINQLCLDFLRNRNDDDGCSCTICLDKFLADGMVPPASAERLFHICEQCGNMYHQRCHQSWSKGCSICKRGHPEPKMDRHGQVEDFPALC